MNTTFLTFFGAIVLAALCFGAMRLRRHPIRDCAAFSFGVLGMIIILSLIKTFLF